MRLEQEAEVLARPPMAALRQGPIEAGEREAALVRMAEQTRGLGAAAVRGTADKTAALRRRIVTASCRARRARRPSSAGWTATCIRLPAATAVAERPTG